MAWECFRYYALTYPVCSALQGGYYVSTMNINIRAVGMDLTPAIKTYVEDKLSGLEKFVGNILNMDVELGLDTNHHNKGEIYSCSVVIQLPKEVITVKKTEKNLYKAIDKVKDHARESMIKTKEKKREEKRKG